VLNERIATDLDDRFWLTGVTDPSTKVQFSTYSPSLRSLNSSCL